MFSQKPRSRFRRLWKSCVFVLALLGVAAVGHIWIVSSFIDDTVYGAEQLLHATRSQIISWEDGRNAVQISYASELPADAFWRIISDHHSYHDLMPGVEIKSERQNGDGTTTVEQVLRLPYTEYQIQLQVSTTTEGPVRKWKWRQTNGPLEADDGAFVVEDHGDKTILRYQASAIVPGCPQWLVNYTMRHRHLAMLELMERHARAAKSGAESGAESGAKSGSAPADVMTAGGHSNGHP